MWQNYLLTTIFLICSNCVSVNSQGPADKVCEDIKKFQTTSMDNYIVGGSEASPGEFPYMVALALETKTNGTLFYCGGTLVSSTCVVTAAHCVDALVKNLEFVVRVGAIDLSNTNWNSNTDIKTTDVTLHPRYDRERKGHDLAVMRINSVQWSYNVHPVCMEKETADPKGPLTIIGFGHTVENGTSSKKLRKATVEAVPRNSCQSSYTRYANKELPDGITEDIMCAKDPQGRQDGCQGDSGGPIVTVGRNDIDHFVGVTAFGRGCATSHPAAYMKISYYRKWIENTCMSS